MVVKAVAAARHWRFVLSAGLTVTVVVLGTGLGSPGGASSGRRLDDGPRRRLDGGGHRAAGASHGRAVDGDPSGAARPMTGTLPPTNPPANIPPASSDILVATNDARADEGVGPMNLELSAFDALTVPEQVFVVENLERTGRGEPPISAMTTQLDSYAQAGAANGRDPTHPLTLTGGGVVIQGGSIWAGGSLSTLFVNYLWMYEDGWGGSAATTTNEDCSPLLPTGCWGHRDIILTEYSPLYCLGSTPIAGDGGGGQHRGAGRVGGGRLLEHVRTGADGRGLHVGSGRAGARRAVGRRDRGHSRRHGWGERGQWRIARQRRGQCGRGGRGGRGTRTVVDRRHGRDAGRGWLLVGGSPGGRLQLRRRHVLRIARWRRPQRADRRPGR